MEPKNDTPDIVQAEQQTSMDQAELQTSMDQAEQQTGMDQAGQQTREAARRLHEVFHRFRHVMRQPAAGHRKVAEMSVMAAVALYNIENGGGIRISDIASQLKISPPTVTQFINNLEREGWVTRNADPQDRRSVLVVLTEEGRRCHDRFEADMHQLFEGLITYLGLADAERLTCILDKAFLFFEEAAEHRHQCHHCNENDRKDAPHGDHSPRMRS